MFISGKLYKTTSFKLRFALPSDTQFRDFVGMSIVEADQALKIEDGELIFCGPGISVRWQASDKTHGCLVFGTFGSPSASCKSTPDAHTEPQIPVLARALYPLVKE